MGPSLTLRKQIGAWRRAGLGEPDDLQFNVVIPPRSPDKSMTASYNV